jgi:hypothetical protein
MMKTTAAPTSLTGVIGRFELREVLGFDLLLGLVAGGAGGWWAWSRWTEVQASTQVASTVVGIVIGALVSAVALVAAFLQPELLRKLALIDREPSRYLGPFLFNALIGIAAALALTVVALAPANLERWPAAIVGGLALGLTAWTLGCLPRGLSTMVQFVQLQTEAAFIDLGPAALADDGPRSGEGLV